jgi:aerobic-type carbon monoxide dehydrogenase small subunit (CoxS/CutS family)
MAHEITVTVNGRPYTRTVELRLLLSDFLRHEFALHSLCE